MSSIVATGNLNKTITSLKSPNKAEAIVSSQNLGGEEEGSKVGDHNKLVNESSESPSCRTQRGDQQDTCERATRRSTRLLKKTVSAATSPDSATARGGKMLSKIKSAEAVSSVARRTRASSFSNHLQKQQQQQQQQHQHQHQHQQAGQQGQKAATSDTEEQQQQQQQQQEDVSDSNNNNLDSTQLLESKPAKKSQEELMEIVDSSRKRRLSKCSADSLSSFIRWSFSNIEQHQQQEQQHKHQAEPIAKINYSQHHSQRHNHNHHHHHHHRDRRGSFSAFAKQHTIVIENNNNNNNSNMKSLARGGANDPSEPDALMLDDEHDWSSLSHNNNNNNNNNSSYQNNNNNHQHGKLSAAEKLFRHAKLESGNSAANLAILRHQHSQLAQAMEQPRFKRQRTQMYSPESADGGGGGAVKQPFAALGSALQQAPSANRKVSSYLGNVVDRLHQQNQGRAPQVGVDIGGEPASEPHEPDSQADSANTGLSYHLQKFLAQQTSLEDLCSSVGLDDSDQLVLAAAIHRALVDSVGPNGGPTSGPAAAAADSKSTASSTGSGSSSAGSAAGHNQNALARRAYNTRATPNSAAASLHAAAAAAAAQAAAAAAARQSNSAAENSTAATLAALNINSRVQQQRHAQAAAALSALAGAGSQQHNGHSHHHNHLQQQQQQQQHHHQLVPNSLNTLANVANSGGGAASRQAASASSTAPNASGGMVDFECDTCGSSFDDRHRLMQHQSIHLELKKDWFNETPVDEVMKIFNRRRGEFLCNTCNLRFEATFDYDKHNHQVHGQRPYCCQFCGNGTRTFRFWRQYLNHLYDHRYIFSCTIDDCDFTVNRRDSLRFHIFRFHLNCQLPQQQTHIRSAGHHNLMALNDSRWPVADDIDDDLDHDDDDDPMMSIGE